ncbi:glycerol-3-phosphate 1-O-acyltransferase PlsY [Hyalangium rubrum]|uniref:Glycerol-3-phosphate acyltransferase n=1 Tax=Hyalangium rubrum TaxID=3103134 RepID=A0ABU5H6W8_9BACT|nr:glycerol-3-phosphate 1-O-acyltransferase PlsY [Hyalangium sp. s54d21]MDY7229223.1 glycerol-3-phosphate 1-O-acyltransferase PlsY [Hyalangium sp. s54d21]
MLAALVLLGYLAGSIPFGVLVTRWARGVDVRAQGSGNIGATNVARVAGKKLGILVLALDALKGAIPVLLALHWMPESPRAHVAVGLAAFLGHCYPVWLKLHGGKGVATALGVLLVLTPLAALAGAGVYVLVLVATRVSSLGSLTAGVAAVATAVFTAPAIEYALLSGVLFAFMIWTHRSNIRRLWRRTERRL